MKMASPDSPGSESSQQREVIEFDDFYDENDSDIRGVQATMRENEIMALIDQM